MDIQVALTDIKWNLIVLV